MDLIKEYLPKTYYADRDSEERIKLFVGHWRRLVTVNQELENKLSHPVEAEVSDDFCEWLEVEEIEGVTYETDCDNKFVCGEWEKLYKTFNYCIYCGKKIKIRKPSKNSR